MRPSSLTLLTKASLLFGRHINDSTPGSDRDNRLVEDLSIHRFQSSGAIYAHQPQIGNAGVLVHTLQRVDYGTPTNGKASPVLVY